MHNACVLAFALKLTSAARSCMHCSSLRRARRRAAGGVFYNAAAQPSLASVRAMWSMRSASHNVHVLDLCTCRHLVFELCGKAPRLRPAPRVRSADRSIILIINICSCRDLETGYQP